MKGLVFLLLLVPVLSFSQKIENTKAEAVGEKIIITYDLTQGEPGDTYTISVFSSFNSFRAPLTRVSGDVGPGVKDGKAKRIEWESRAEMGNFKGSLTFEVEAIVIAPLSLKTEIASMKRGSTAALRWRGGDQNQEVKMELLKGTDVQGVIATVANNGSYEWQVPGNQKPGKDYTVRLVNGRETVSSNAFTIKPKIPLWAKVAVPLAVVGVLLIPKSSSSDGGTSGKLPAPPEILN